MLSPQQLQHEIVEAMRDIMRADAASLSLADAERKHFELVASVGLSEHYTRSQRPDYATGRALYRGSDTHFIVDLRESPIGDRALFESEGLRTVLTIPLVSGDELIGALNAYLRDGSPDFREDSIDLAHVLAVEATVALENERLYEGALRGRDYARRLVDSLGTPVFIAHPPGVVGGLNRAATEMTGLEVAPGRPLTELLMSLGARMVETGELLTRSPLEEGLAGREWRGEVAFRHRITGEERSADVLVRPVRDTSGKVMAAVMTLHELTELRRLEQEKEAFLKIVSHELRTPLTPLKALAQVLISRIRRSRERGQPLDLESFEHNLGSVERQVDRMNGLVSDLLSVSRAGRGMLELERRPFDLAVSVRDIVERYVHATREEGRHRFVIEAPETLAMNGDPARIEQVLMNLVGNAVKYSPGGGVVRVSLAQREGRAEIVITDEGIGILAEDLPHLGAAFTRGTGKAASFPGMGIGLHVAKLLCEAHGGALRIESDGLPGFLCVVGVERQLLGEHVLGA